MNTIEPDVVSRWFDVGANVIISRLQGEHIPGVMYYLSHHIPITQGEHQGARVSVISLVSLEPKPQYLVELPGGSDMVVRLSHLEADDETWRIAEGLGTRSSS